MSMYKFEKTVTLVTIASSINQNLALMEPNEYINADSLACIHEGYINVIPILNEERHGKYVPLQGGKHRGKGEIKQVKWLRLNGEIIFVVASTVGLQIYDAELSDIKYCHACRSTASDMDYTVGICVIEPNILCIGTNVGVVWMFKGGENNTDFKVIERIHAHDEPIKFLDGMGTYWVSSSGRTTYLWTLCDKQYEISRNLQVEGLLSTPTALKVSSYLIFIGYESGELCVFDMLNFKFCIRLVAHKLKVTAIDFSALKHFTLTGSIDCYIKIWTFTEFDTEGICIFSVFNETGPLCGAAFLNHNCTEFCAVTASDIAVNIYVKEGDE